jgi:hypothetical protein
LEGGGDPPPGGGDPPPGGGDPQPWVEAQVTTSALGAMFVLLTVKNEDEANTVFR